MTQYKNNSGQFLLKGLFKETSTHPNTPPAYTLQEKDRGDLKSLYLLYLQANDPLERNFAKAYLGGWNHWKKLTSSLWFKPIIERWREELDTKIRAEALINIRELAETSDGNTKYQVNKFLLEGKWNTNQPVDETTKTTKRLPKKQDIKTQATQELRGLDPAEGGLLDQVLTPMEQEVLDDHIKLLAVKH